MPRVIRIYNTQTTNRNQVESAATSWGDLQRDLNAASIGFGGMKAVIGETELTLESPTAVLPEGEFTLFLMPTKVKSGHHDSDFDNDEFRDEFIDEPAGEEPDPKSSKPQAALVHKLISLSNEMIALAHELDQMDFTLSPEEMELSTKGKELAKKLAAAFS